MLIFAFVIFVIIITLIIQSTRKPYKYPPGPKWLPFFGCQLEFKNHIKKHGALYTALTYLSQIYNSEIIGLKLGSEKTICVSGYENIKKVLTSEEYEGRPDNFFLRLRAMGTRNGITFTDGEHWHEQRSFVMRHLRDVGFGKKTMERFVLEELDDLLKLIKKSGWMKREALFSSSILSVLWTLVAGSRISREDPIFNTLIQLLLKRSAAFNMAGNALSHMPWLRFIAPDATGYNLILSLNNQLKQFLMETIEDHHRNYTGEESDLIFAFIKEMKNRENENSRFTNDQLLMICLDLFIAGSQTTDSSLGFIFYQLLKRPDIQQRIYEEIEQTIPKSRSPTLEDKSKLNYTSAFLLEIRRLYPVASVGGPRRVLKNTVLSDYHIPKDTSVLLNIWSVVHDYDYWKDPDVCRPERFIDSDGLFKTNERVFNFGLGKRKCPGDALAKSVIFLFTVGILQKFKIATTTPNSEIPNPKVYPGLTMTPAAFNIQFIPR